MQMCLAVARALCCEFGGLQSTMGQGGPFPALPRSPTPVCPPFSAPGPSRGVQLGGAGGKVCQRPARSPEGRGEMLAGGAGPRGLPTPFPSTLFPPYGSHKVWAQRQQPEEVAVYRELLCGRGGGGGGSKEKGGKEGKEGRGWGLQHTLPSGGLWDPPPRLSEVRGPEEIHVPP